MEVGYRSSRFGRPEPQLLSEDSFMGVMDAWRDVAHGDETVRNVETAVEVVKHIAEVTEKLATNVADQLPENGCLHKAVEKVEYIAEVVDKDAEKIGAIAEKVCFHNPVFS
ncbi:hypothetical protein ABZP36_026037 [Zizania latifolia]